MTKKRFSLKHTNFSKPGRKLHFQKSSHKSRAFKSFKKPQQTKHLRHLPFQKSVRRTVRIQRYHRTRRCNRTRKLYSRYAFVSTLLTRFRSKQGTISFKRFRRARRSVRSLRHLQERNYIVARYVQPTTEDAFSSTDTARLAVTPDSSNQGQFSGVRSYRLPTVLHDNIGAGANTDTVRGVYSPRINRIDRSVNSLLSHRYRQVYGLSKRVLKLLRLRRRRYFSRRVRKMYVEQKRTRMSKTKFFKKTKHSLKSLVIRKAQRSHYKFLVGKLRRYVARRDRLQINRIAQTIKYRRYLAHRTFRQLQSFNPDRRKVYRAHRATSYKLSSSKLTRLSSSFFPSNSLDLDIGASSYITNTVQTKAATFSKLSTRLRAAAATTTYARPNYYVNLIVHYMELPSKPLVSSTVDYHSALSTQRAQFATSLRLLRAQRARIRLPHTYVSRIRRRRSGNGMFASRLNTYGASVVEQRRQLLPPTAISVPTQTSSVAVSANDTLAGTPVEDSLPHFWLRPPIRSQRKVVYWLRRRASEQHRRVSRAKNRSEKKFLLHLSSHAANRVSRGVKTRIPDIQQREGFVTAVSAKLQVPTVTRESSSLYGQSAGRMRAENRKLPGWAPRYQNRWHSWALPRNHGLPGKKYRPSKDVLRVREQLNIMLARNNLPQHVYRDQTQSHVQFYAGSASTSGYTRPRRTFRAPSSYGRWSLPAPVAVPFVSPLSQRHINAKHFQKQNYDSALPSLKRKTVGLSGNRTEIRIPARLVPWRNFSYRRPQQGAPATLQRWTAVNYGRRKTTRTSTVVSHKGLVLRRRARQLRSVDLWAPRVRAWTSARWQTLDVQQPNTVSSQQLLSLVAQVPPATWAALRRRTASLAQYARVQKLLMTAYLSWAYSAFVSLDSSTLNATQTAQAFAFLGTLLRHMLSSKQSVEKQAQVMVRNLQQKQAQTSLFDKRVSSKITGAHVAREFPSILAVTEETTTDLLSRGQGASYRRWLQGASRYLRQAQNYAAPQAYSRFFVAEAADFGRSRTRFPASGRRKTSYDSMLHAFVKRTAPSKFRGASTVRFHRIFAEKSADFRENNVLTVRTGASARKATLVRHAGASEYLSTAWRALLPYSHVLKPSLTRSAYKRRFAALPLEALHREQRRILQKALPVVHQSAYAVRRGVLRSALRRRRQEHAYLDLRVAVLQRRLPREKALRTQFIRRLNRARPSGRRGAFHKLVLARSTRPTLLWSLHRREPITTRRHNLAFTVLRTLPSGENLLTTQTEVRRDPRATSNFGVLQSNKRMRLRRTSRDSKKYLLRGWRRGRVARLRTLFRATKHWSENKNMLRFSALSSYQRPRFVKRFLRTSIRALSALQNTTFSGESAIVKHPVFTTSVSATTSAAHPSTLLTTHFCRPQALMVTPVASSQQKSFTKSLDARKPLSHWKRRRASLNKRLRSHLRQNDHVVSCTDKQHFAAHRSAALVMNAAMPVGDRPALLDLTPEAIEMSGVTPLHFQTPMIRLIRTEKEKQADLLADLTAKEEPYQLTGQYAESLTAFLPELMNSLVSSRIIKNYEKLSYRTAKNVIRNIYWGLRIYLNVDPFDIRFNLRDSNPGVRLATLDTMEDAAENRVISQPTRAELRYRLQPGRVLRVRNKLRFRGDWLRLFLPKSFALYQENPNEYGFFLLRTADIRRLRAGSRGIASWWTTVPPTTLETRTRQFMSRRYSRTTPRFETLLQTIRRPLAHEEVPFVGPNTLKNNFFAREYSTAVSTRLVGRLAVHTLRLRPPTAESLFSEYQAITARYRVLPIAEARGRTRYASNRLDSIGSTRIDTRFTRVKSPRSRQYVLRTNKASSCLEIFADSVSRRKALVTALIPLENCGAHVYRTRRFIRGVPATPLLTSWAAIQNTRLSISTKISARKAEQRTGVIIRKNQPRLLPTHALVSRREVSISNGNKLTGALQHTAVSGYAMNANTRSFAASCTNIARQEKTALFDTFRSHLWQQLTARHMKRHRIARHWLKGASRWLRDPWLADVVTVQPDKGILAGELRVLEQQIGEYVADVDAFGHDIPQERALQERHTYAPRPTQKLTELRKVSRARGLDKTFARQRLKVSKWVRRKPIPTMWLANYECNEFMKEYAEEKIKKPEQKVADTHARTLVAYKRRVRGLPPEQARRDPLKIPALHWLPHIIWKEIQRRIRQFEWRESDDAFARKGFRNAFRFYPAERNRAPWLEALMYTRATFSTRLGEFRRHSFPREQKKFKWLQRFRKVFARTSGMRYLKRRRWPQLRSYNQRLHRSLFSLPTQRAARKHFEKLSKRTRPAISGFINASRGLNDRLDVTLVHLKIVPSIFWAKVVAPMGLLKINGKIVFDPAFRLPANSVVQPLWSRILRFQHFFQPSLGRRDDYKRRTRNSTSCYPTNFEYFRGTSTLIYKHAPDEADLRRSDRVQPAMLRWFKLDSA